MSPLRPWIKTLGRRFANVNVRFRQHYYKLIRYRLCTTIYNFLHNYEAIGKSVRCQLNFSLGWGGHKIICHELYYLGRATESVILYYKLVYLDVTVAYGTDGTCSYGIYFSTELSLYTLKRRSKVLFPNSQCQFSCTFKSKNFKRGHCHKRTLTWTVQIQ